MVMVKMTLTCCLTLIGDDMVGREEPSVHGRRWVVGKTDPKHHCVPGTVARSGSQTAGIPSHLLGDAEQSTLSLPSERPETHRMWGCVRTLECREGRH